ncbi:unnamed protein product [Heligmosomoides polygyrus]|uniref:Uncharacterized protein n=1 Tax=Heligmosomoides polygyrus TaxID=6339 RepID=A0A183FNC5_HELPZ|nr:unnamed protein product [Heligmosomoides polygyrus]
MVDSSVGGIVLGDVSSPDGAAATRRSGFHGIQFSADAGGSSRHCHERDLAMGSFGAEVLLEFELGTTILPIFEDQRRRKDLAHTLRHNRGN